MQVAEPLRRARTTGLRIFVLIFVTAALLTTREASANHISLLFSTSPDRSAAAALDGSTVTGNIYIFTSPDDSAIDRVDFYYDDPGMAGAPAKSEKNEPYDLAGGSRSVANPLDTTVEADGAHTVTARVIFLNLTEEVISGIFVIANSAPSLVFNPAHVSFVLDEDQASAPVSTTLSSSDSSSAPFTLDVPADPWLSVVPSGSTTPASVDISVDSTGLAPGFYSATIAASTAGLNSAALSVNLSIAGGFDILSSTSPGRGGPVALDGQTVSGNIYVFTSPDAGVDSVQFWIDNPGMAGPPDKTENNEPYDLRGSTSSGNANPFDTVAIADGPHSITARLSLDGGGTEVRNADFTVSNNQPSLVADPNSLRLSADLGGTGTSATVDVTATSGIADVAVNVPAGAGWLTVSPPSGQTPLALVVTADPNGLAAATYTATVDLVATGYVGASLSITFEVVDTTPTLDFALPSVLFSAPVGSSTQSQNVDLTASSGITPFTLSVQGSPSWLTVGSSASDTPSTIDITVDASGLQSATYSATVDATAAGHHPDSLQVTMTVFDLTEPDQVHLAWTDDPSTTLAVLWRTQLASTPSNVEYRVSGDTAWLTATGAIRPSGTDGTLHLTGLTGLTPATRYEYRVARDGGGFSQIYSARTAPPSGPSDFDLVFVADTGIVGRLDGLATGTQQVIDEIAALDPDFVLLGGDYAYFNTDTRFATLDEAIDAWFDQMQPVGSAAPLLPTYGNHELSGKLGETVGPWIQRFPTPSGIAPTFYSFDIGDAHFISIAAWHDRNDLANSHRDWVRQDIQSAIARGKTWIVPYFHVSPFADGTNHPSNLDLRDQLGSIFEAHDIDLVLTTHDQAYERTFPLSGVGVTDTPTTTELSCYTKSEGVTFAKISPGGKMSNISGGFSPFASDPAPAWTAVRNNTMHNFGRLSFTADGTMRLQVYGIVGDGTPPVILDDFEYRTGQCAEALQASTGSLSFSHVIGNPAPASQLTTITTPDGGAANVSVSVPSSAPWLNVSPGSGPAPLGLSVSVDPSGLPEGVHTTSITVTDSGAFYRDVQIDVSLVVTDGTPPLAFDLPSIELAALLGQPAGPETVTVTALTGVANVSLTRPAADTWLTINAGSGLTPHQSQISADTTGLAAGTYNSTVTASAPGFDDAVLPVMLQVTESIYNVMYSTLSNRSSPLGLNNATVQDLIYVFTSPDSGVAKVEFWIDNPTMAGTPDRAENNPPYDLKGGTGTAANPLNTASFTDGPHSITARFTLASGSPEVVTANFTVSNNQPALVLSPSGLSLSADAGGAAVSQVSSVSATTGTADVGVNVPSSATWLSVTPLSGQTPLSLLVTADPAGLAPGTYSAAVSVTAAGYTGASLSVVFNVIDTTPTLQFDVAGVSFTADVGGNAPDQNVTISSSDGVAAFSLNIPEDATWLAISPQSGTTPRSLTLAVDTTGLAAGTYSTVVTASASGHNDDTLDVTVQIGSTYSILYSTNSARSSAVQLAGANVQGLIYAFTTPDSGVDRVLFWIDDPAMAGSPVRNEGNAPYDLAGGSTSTANPLDTITLANGIHTVTARVQLLDGTTEIANATFTVSN